MVHQNPWFEVATILILGFAIQSCRFAAIMINAAWITLINPGINIEEVQRLLHGK